MQDKTIRNMHKQKRFFKSIYDPLIGKGNNLEPGQHIRVFQVKDDYNTQAYFNNLDDLISYLNHPGNKHLNNYFTLATTDGQGGKTDNLVSRTVLGFDFDKKAEADGFNHIDVMNRFKAIGLYYHALVDSGNGYHAYIMINPTDNLEQVQATQKTLGEMLRADMDALKPTQLLRIPGTYNTKQPQYKRVNVIHLQEDIKRNGIEDLYNKYCSIRTQNSGNKATSYTLQNTNIPPCIGDILRHGSKDGNRYKDLQKIVVTLRQRNKTLNEIMATVKEWAYKSDYNDRLEYLTQNIYDNLKHVKLECMSCQRYGECNGVQSEFEYPEEHAILTMTETRARTLKDNKRKGVKVMNGNALMIYGVLMSHKDGLYRDEIIREITYNGKPRLSDKTLTAALNSLEKNAFISCTSQRPKFYKVEPIRAKVEMTFNISYAATYEAIKGRISTEELRLYNYMRYLHNKQQREDNKVLQGNLFQINQVELAKELGITRGRVTQMINNLLNEKLLSIWHRQPSRNNGYPFNIYRLNY